MFFLIFLPSDNRRLFWYVFCHFQETNESEIRVEDRTLIDLPIEIIHRIFDFCDVQTILINIRQVCRTLFACSNTYDRFSLILEKQDQAKMKLISRLIRPQSVTSLQIINKDSYAADVNTRLLSIFNNCPFPRLRSLAILCNMHHQLEELLQMLNSQSLIELSVNDGKYYYRVRNIFVKNTTYRKVSISSKLGYKIWSLSCTKRSSLTEA